MHNWNFIARTIPGIGDLLQTKLRITCSQHLLDVQARRQVFVVGGGGGGGGAFHSKMDGGGVLFTVRWTKGILCNKTWMTGFVCHIFVSVFTHFCHQFTYLRKQMNRYT